MAETSTTSGRIRAKGSERPTEITDGLLDRFERSIDTVKAGVLIEQVANEYGEFRFARQDRLEGRCVAPDHEDKTPSMSIFTESQRFKCFGCQRSGDVVDLEMLAGNHDQLWTAMVALSVRYGVELPQRSAKWHQWQAEKHRIEDLAETIRFQVGCRRAFKVLVLNSPEIQGIENPNERREEIRLCWEAFLKGMRKVRQ